jgi:hypothetical protein
MDSRHDGDSRDELCKSHHADTPMRSTHPLLPIPAGVQRMMVLYPRGESPEWSSAYSRLEGAAFQL